MIVSNKLYEVYLCKYKDEVVYVGQGGYKRHKHCNSGTSHVYELNRLHFSGAVFDVDVKIFNSKVEAVEREKELIKRYLPKFNRDFMQTDKQMKGAERSLFKATWLSYIDNNEKSTKARREKLHLIVDEFMRYHTHDMIKEEGLLLRGHGIYETANLHRLGSVVKNLRFGKVTGGMPDIFKETLENTYSECFGKTLGITWTMDKKLDEI